MSFKNAVNIRYKTKCLFFMLNAERIIMCTMQYEAQYLQVIISPETGYLTSEQYNKMISINKQYYLPAYLQISRARRASPDRAATLRAASCMASSSKAFRPFIRDRTIVCSCLNVYGWNVIRVRPCETNQKNHCGCISLTIVFCFFKHVALFVFFVQNKKKRET